MGPLNPAMIRIPGLWAWYDAQHAGDLVLSGSAVAQWKDRSGHNRHIGQLTSGNQPHKTGNINGHDCVTFDGGDFLRGACVSPDIKGMYGVFVVDTDSGSRMFLVDFIDSAGVGGIFHRQWWIANNPTHFLQAGWVDAGSSSWNYQQQYYHRLGEPSLWGWSGSAAANDMWIRQWEQELNIHGSIAGKKLGEDVFDVGMGNGADGFYGRIGELMLFDVVHTLAERTYWIDTLGAKWGIVPATSMLDDCNRANVGPPPGGIWCEASNAKILSSKLRSNGGDESVVAWRPLSSINMWAQADLSQIDGNMVRVRTKNFDSTNDYYGYHGRYYTGTAPRWEIYRRDSSGFTLIGSQNGAVPSLPYTCRLQAVGNGSTVYLSLYEILSGVPHLRCAATDTSADRIIDDRRHFGWRGLSGSDSDNWQAQVVDVTSFPAAPSVTINKGASQADPFTAGGTAVIFDVVFDDYVSGFTAADVDLSASTVSGTLGCTVTEVIGGKTFTVSVTGYTSSGNIIASIPAAAAVSATTGASSNASTSTDNSVAITYAPFDPVTAFAWKHLYYVNGPAFQALGLSNGASMASTNWPDEIAANAAPLNGGGGTYQTSVSQLNGKKGVKCDASTGKKHTTTVASGGQQTLPYSVIIVWAFASGGFNGYIADGANEGNSGTRVLVRTNGGVWNLYMGTSQNGSSIAGSPLAKAIRVKATSSTDVMTVDGGTVVSADAGGGTWQGMSWTEAGVVPTPAGWAAMYGVYPGDITTDPNWSAFCSWMLSEYGIVMT